MGTYSTPSENKSHRNSFLCQLLGFFVLVTARVNRPQQVAAAVAVAVATISAVKGVCGGSGGGRSAVVTICRVVWEV